MQTSASSATPPSSSRRRRHDRARRPVPDRQPEGGGERRRRRSRRRSCSRTATPTTIGDTVDIAKRTGATVVAIVELADEIGERGRRGRARPEPRRHRHVRLGLGPARARLAHLDDAERHASTRPPAWSSTSAASSSTTSATRRCSPTWRWSAARRQDRRRARADRRPLHDGPPRRRRAAVELVDADAVIPCHYDTFPPIETDAEAFKSDVEQRRLAQVVVLEPGRDAPAEVTHAIVLIEAERAALPTLGGALADVEGVAEAYSVTGEWDFVAIVRVREPETSPRSSPRQSASSRDPAHADDGRLRGLLPARPRGAVLASATDPCSSRRPTVPRSRKSSPACPRAIRYAAIAVLALLAAGGDLPAAGGATAEDGTRVVVEEPIAFNLRYPDGDRQRIEDDALFHLRARRAWTSSSSSRSSCRRTRATSAACCPSRPRREVGAAQGALPEPRAGGGGQGAHQPRRPATRSCSGRSRNPRMYGRARAAARARPAGARTGVKLLDAGHARGRRGQGARRRHERRG